MTWIRDVLIKFKLSLNSFETFSQKLPHLSLFIFSINEKVTFMWLYEWESTDELIIQLGNLFESFFIVSKALWEFCGGDETLYKRTPHLGSIERGDTIGGDEIRILWRGVDWSKKKGLSTISSKMEFSFCFYFVVTRKVFHQKSLGTGRKKRKQALSGHLH